MNLMGGEEADVALVFEIGEDLGPCEVRGFGDFEADEESAGGVGGGGVFPDGLRVVVLDFFTGGRVETFGDVAEPDFEEIGKLRHRADGGAGGFDGVGLLDGDRRADIFDGVDFGFVEQVEKLARVGRKSFDVPALAFGVESVENEGRFAGAAEAGDGDVAAKGDVEIEAFEVILANATQADALGFGDDGRGSGNFFNHGWARMNTDRENAIRGRTQLASADRTRSGVGPTEPSEEIEVGGDLAARIEGGAGVGARFGGAGGTEGGGLGDEAVEGLAEGGAVVAGDGPAGAVG